MTADEVKPCPFCGINFNFYIKEIDRLKQENESLKHSYKLLEEHREKVQELSDLRLRDLTSAQKQVYQKDALINELRLFKKCLDCVEKDEQIRVLREAIEYLLALAEDRLPNAGKDYGEALIIKIAKDALRATEKK